MDFSDNDIGITTHILFYDDVGAHCHLDSISLVKVTYRSADIQLSVCLLLSGNSFHAAGYDSTADPRP